MTWPSTVHSATAAKSQEESKRTKANSLIWVTFSVIHVLKYKYEWERICSIFWSNPSHPDQMLAVNDSANHRYVQSWHSYQTWPVTWWCYTGLQNRRPGFESVGTFTAIFVAIKSRYWDHLQLFSRWQNWWVCFFCRNSGISPSDFVMTKAG